MAATQPTGGIIGVASKSTETSLRVYNGRTKYNEWQFIYLATTAQPGGGDQGAAGSGAGMSGGGAGRVAGAAVMVEAGAGPVPVVGMVAATEAAIPMAAAGSAVEDPGASSFHRSAAALAAAAGRA